MVLYKIKKTFFFLFLIIFSQLVNAQQNETNDFNFVRKNTFQTGIYIKGLLAGDNFFEYTALTAGKFFKDNFLAGIETGYGFFGYWERSYCGGFFGRYYLKVKKRFSYFAQAEYLLGKTIYNNTETLSQWSGITQNAGLNAGIAYRGFYKKHISINFICGYDFNYLYVKNHPVLGKYIFSKHDISYAFQINYFF